MGSKDGTCVVSELGRQNEAGKPIDDESTDMRVELLQRDLRLSSQEKKLQKTSTLPVKKWTCKGSQAYQSTTANDNSWTKIKLLNLSTGLYGTELDLDLGKFAGEPGCENGKCKIRSMNGCAIHHKSSTLYCAMQIYDRGCFLVALDQTGNIGFVSKLNGFRYAATFFQRRLLCVRREGFCHYQKRARYDST